MRMKEIYRREMSAKIKEIITALPKWKRTIPDVVSSFKMEGIKPPKEKTIINHLKSLEYIDDDMVLDKSPEMSNGESSIDEQIYTVSQFLTIKNLREQIGAEKFDALIKMLK